MASVHCSFKCVDKDHLYYYMGASDMCVSWLFTCVLKHVEVYGCTEVKFVKLMGLHSRLKKIWMTFGITNSCGYHCATTVSTKWWGATAELTSWRSQTLSKILGKFQKASANDRMICFARFCQIRLNYVFILPTEKFTLERNLLSHKHLSNLRNAQP